MVNIKLINYFFSLNQLMKLTSQKLILPFYHTISDNRLPHISNLYQIRTIIQFENDLDYLCKHYQPISIQELYDISYNRVKMNKPSFHLTFDDGLKELYTEIAPILERKGIPATFFINTEFVDNKALFYRYKVSLLIEKISKEDVSRIKLSKYFGINENNLKELKNRLLSFNYSDIPEIDRMATLLGLDFAEYLDANQPYLSKIQIEKLIERGFSIGSHSLNHPLFKDIDLKEKKRQITESFYYLEKELNLNDYYFSFPFSDESVECDFFNWLYNVANCKLSFGISGLKRDFTKYHLHRIPFEQQTNSVQNIIKGEYLYYVVKSIFNKNIINRK